MQNPEQTQTPAPFEQLPFDALLEIFAHLPPETILETIPQLSQSFYKKFCGDLHGNIKTAHQLWEILYLKNFKAEYLKIKNGKVTDWCQAFLERYKVEYKGFPKHLREAFSCLKIGDIEGFKKALVNMTFNDLEKADTSGTTLLNLLITTEHQEAREAFHEWILDARKKNKSGAKKKPLLFWDVFCKRSLAYIKDRQKKHYKEDNVNPVLKPPQKRKHGVNQAPLTLLHHAAACGHLDLLKYLIDEKKIDPGLILNHKSTTAPVYLAAINGHIDVLRYLTIFSDLMLNEVDMCDLFSELTKHGHINILNYLMNENRLPLDFKQINLLLIVAIENSNTELVLRLLQSAITLTDYQFILNNALCRASQKGYLEIVKILAEQGTSLNGFKDKPQSAPLYSAIYGGKIEIVKYLIEHGADVNENYLILDSTPSFTNFYPFPVSIHAPDSTSHKSTPLHTAVINNDIDILIYLIDNNANVEAIDSKGKSLFHLALEAGHSDIVAYFATHEKLKQPLLNIMPLHLVIAHIGQKTREHRKKIAELKLDINKKSSSQSTIRRRTDRKKYVTENFNTALEPMMKIIKVLIENNIRLNTADEHGCTPLHIAAKFGLLDIAKNLITKKEVDINAVDAAGNTPLHFSIMEDRGLAEYLISNGANINAINNHGDTPLHQAVSAGQSNVVQCLIEHGAKIDIAAFDDTYTPLHLAAQLGHLEIVKLFTGKKGKSKCDLTPVAVGGVTPIQLAVKGNHLKVVKFLIAKDKTLLNDRDSHGHTLLHTATISSSTEIIEYLLIKKLDINAKNARGDTPLYSAAILNSLEVVKCLVEKGADMTIANANGFTPLDAAAEYDHIDITKVIVEKQPNINPVSALSLAIQFGRFDTATYLINNCKVTLDFSHIQLALQFGHLDMAKYLVNSSIEDDKTFLVRAIQDNNIEMVQHLITAGADINLASKNGWTPLGAAIASNNPLMIALILAHPECNPNQPYLIENNSTTPLLTAAAAGNTALVSTLLEKGAKLEISADFQTTASNITDIKIILALLKSVTPNNYSFHFLFLKQAIARKDWIAIKFLSDLTPVDIKDKDHKTTLLLLLESKDDNLISSILSQANTQTLQNFFFWAVENQRLDVIKLIQIQHKIDVNKKNALGKTALITVIRLGYDDIAEYLLSLKYIDPNAMIKGLHQTALAIALARKNQKIAMLLLNHPFIDPTRYVGSGIAPLILAAQNNDPEIVKRILDKKANPNITIDGDFETPLAIAVSHNNLEMVKYLLEAGANPNLYYLGIAPLEIAFHANNIQIVELLLDKGAKLKPSDTLLKHLQIIAQNADMLKILSKIGPPAEEFFSNDKHTNLTRFFVNAMLNTNSIPMLNFLLTKGFKPDFLFYSNSDYSTLLIAAITKKQDGLALIRHLLLNGANVNLTNSKGETPLLAAITKKDMNLISLLLEKGAIPGPAELEKAKSLGLTDIVTALENARLSHLEKTPDQTPPNANHLTNFFRTSAAPAATLPAQQQPPTTTAATTPTLTNTYNT